MAGSTPANKDSSNNNSSSTGTGDEGARHSRPNEHSTVEAVHPRTTGFLLAARFGRDAATDSQALRAEVDQMVDVDVVAAVGGVEQAPDWALMRPPVVRVQASPQRIGELAASGRWLIEPDQPLIPVGYAGAGSLPVGDPALLGSGDPEHIIVVVYDDTGRPVPHAAVYATEMWPAYGVTDADGRAQLTMPPGCVETVSLLLVVPQSGAVSRVIHHPDLRVGRNNVVTVTLLESMLDGFPGRPHTSWGAQALRVGQLPPNYRGHGINIALVDSGIASDHPQLGRVTQGAKLVADPAGWSMDTLGSGTACAGIIAAGDTGAGIVGLAPDANVHAIKVTPGGTLATLLGALDYCITHQIDIVQVNVTVGTGSQLLAAKLADVRNAGIGVIAPAGDTGGAIAIPAAVLDVMSVGAIGRPGSFPPDSVHAAHVAAGHPGPDGDLPATFTPSGPGIDLVGPGIAIPTTTPDGGYALRDGTALAAAHITALAALLLAHHDDFAHAYTSRSAQRVDHLQRLLLSSCRPVREMLRTGAGLPDASKAFGIPTPLETDWETAVLYQLQLHLVRAGYLQEQQ